MTVSKVLTHRVTMRLFAVTALFLACVIFARAQMLVPGVEKTLHVYPVSISSTEWQNIAALYFRDAHEDALYQDFNTENAAFIALPTESSETTESPEVPQSEPEVVPEEEVVTPAVEGAADVVPSTPAETIPDSESQEAEDVPQEVSLGSFSPFAIARTKLALLFEEVIEYTTSEESVTEPEVTEEPTVIEETEVSPTSTPAAPEPEPIASSTPLPDEIVEPSVPEPIASTTVSASSTPDLVASSTDSLPQTASTTRIFCEGVRGCGAYSIELEGFSIPGLDPSETIENAQLRLSLGAKEKPVSIEQGILVEYDLGEGWQSAGSAALDDELSNALNGGYFLYALPPIEDPSQLSRLRVRVTFYGDNEAVEGVYLDSAWLELRVLALDEEMLRARVLPEALDSLKAPDLHELLSRQLDFTNTELPTFALRYHEQRNFFIKLFRRLFADNVGLVETVSFMHEGLGDVGIVPEVNITEDGLWSIRIPEEERDKLRPGVYTLQIAVDEGGKIFEDSFEFQWGLLAFNTHQSEYALGDSAEISLAALSPNGNTVCDADLLLYVIQPDGFIRRLPVEQSGLCSGNNVIDVPDYTANYQSGMIGTHTLYLERVDADGSVIAHTEDSFEVVSESLVSIARTGPTRIYPVEPYLMEMTVTAAQSFSGTVQEFVPHEFEIIETDARVVDRGTEKMLEWDVALAEGESQTFTYRFDAPDLSPYLYTVGPAVVEANGIEVTASLSASSTDAFAEFQNGFTFTEHRAWQIASDATGNMIIYWTGTGAVPSGWTCLSCGSGTFYQRFVQGGSTYNSTGGATTHTHSASGSVLASTATGNENFNTGTLAVVAHGHSYTPTISTANNLPSYKQLRVLQYTNAAGTPPSLPANAMVMFDATPPTGWTASTTMAGRYAYGGNTPGAVGGSNTHTHTITGTTGAASGSTVGRRGGSPQVSGANASHTHTVSSSTASQSSEPPYIEVIFAESSIATTTPTGMIAMWTDTPPPGWLDVSSNSGDPFYQRFPKGSATYGATGGASTHTPSNVTGITSSGPSATTNGVQGVFTAAGTHTHSVDVTSFTSGDHLPPYLTAIFAKRLPATPLYTQNGFRLYANQNAQTPTDPWPSGAINLNENETLTATSTPIKNGEEIRIRMNVYNFNATSTAGSADFKLQYGSGDVCTSVSAWTDVGAIGSGVVWRGYNNTSVADGGTLSSTTLSDTTVAQTYEEQNPSSTTPNQIGIDDIAEWDWVVEHNGADAGTNYCFRMVESDGTQFFAYDRYPSVRTDYAPESPTHEAPFDNEKLASTSPWFEFSANDPEGQELHYQIQIDDDFAFGSTAVDNNTESHSARFENLVTDTDKEPYNNAELIRFKTAATLTNNTTYWWRVRAKDPDGSNAWGSWSDPQSFTVDTSLTASAWFQSTDEQFDTNVLVGTESTGSDSISLISGSTTGTVTSDLIDFDWGSAGTAWGELSFNDTKPPGSITYQIQYYTGSTWTLIPNTALSGNSTGFSSSPVSLLDLDTDTYNQIRVIANFANSGGAPSLQDWTVAWGYRVETPTIAKLFPNEKVGTTTPIFEFTTTDPQNDDLTYQIQWSTDNTFAASTTRTSDSSGGFEDVTSVIETDPFPSGDTIRYTVQGGDALTNNTTYWWRVRAKDTTGDNAYSLWTQPRSFTVDTTVTVSTWFQTTDEQFESNTLSGTRASGSDTLEVATDPVEAMLVYGENITQTPQYRQWDGSAWGSEGSADSVSAPIRWAVTRAGTQREEYITATLGTDADVNVQVFANGAWDDLQEITIDTGNIGARGFDVAYESLSGDAIAASCDGDPDPTYYVWNGTSWTLGGTINLSSANNCEWIQLASDPTSDEIIILSRDSTGSQYEAQVWSGSSWGNATTQGSVSTASQEGMAVIYEESGGQALIVTSDGNPARFRWNSWNGSAWGTAATVALTSRLSWGMMARDDGSDNVALCYIDNAGNVGVVRWTGAAWTGQTDLDAAANANTDRAVSCQFETNGGRNGYIMAAYSDATNVRYRSFNGTTWAAEASVSTIEDSATVQLTRTGDGTLLLLALDDVNDRYDFSSWNGTSWSAAQTLEDNASIGGSAPFGEPFMIAARNPGRNGGVIVSPEINFSDGSGPYWDTFSWNDVTPGTSNILYQMEYYNGSTWALIPNVDLPGNSTGTSTSPIDLSSLSVSTYDVLRPVASLSCDNSSNCPEIQDWTLEWAEGITVSGTLHQYDRTSSTTSGSIAVAVNGVLQTGKTGAVSSGSWSISNVTAFAGDVITVFVDGAADTNEASGVTVYDGTGDITGFSLYERHLAIGSNDVGTVRNSHIELYDFTDDEDIFSDVDGGNDLSICAGGACTDARLIIKTGNTYQPGPGGNVTTHDFVNNGTVVANGNTIRVSGSWDNNATFTSGTSTVIFTATSSSESLDETGATSPSFYNLTFGESSGTATWNVLTALDVNNALAVTYGTLSRGTRTITVAGNLSTGASGYWTGVGTTTFDGTTAATWSDANATKQNIGRVLVDGTSKTITLGSHVRAQSITIGANDILDASTSHYNIEVLGGWTNTNVFVPRSGTVNFIATTTGNTITHGTSNFYNLTFSGSGGTWAFTQTTVTASNNFTVSNGTVTLPTATTTVGGSFDSTGGTFAHNNGTVLFNGSGARTVTTAGGPFTNTFYNLTFGGSGTYTMATANATTSNDVRITSGSVTLPSGTFALGGSFYNSAGTFTHNSGTLKFTSTVAETIGTNGSSFNALTFAGSGSWSFTNANVTAAGTVRIDSGTLTHPSGTFTIGGSYDNNASIVHNNGTVLFNSADAGESVDQGGGSFYSTTFNSATGGWTITSSATSTNAFTLTAASAFTLQSGAQLSVGGTFTNAVGGAATTWSGSTLRLYSGTTYALNTKTNTGDAYETLRLSGNTDVSMWNSSAVTYTLDSNASLYSQDHAAVDGDLYVFGAYTRSSGTEHWDYATDFDGTALGGGSRQVDVRFASGASAALSGSTLSVVGTSAATTTVAAQSGTYTISMTGGTTTAQYYGFSDLGSSGVSLLGGTVVTSLSNGYFRPGTGGGTGLTVSSTTIDANPGEQIFDVEFSTTTPISAYNVAQIGGAPASYWWFRESYGNLDGEAYDSDTGDPGSIRWDDSSLTITVAGVVYSDIGLTPMGAPVCDDVTNNVRLVVDGTTTYDTSCSSADGSYSIPGVVVLGDPVLTVFLNTNGGARATAITQTPTTNISDFDLYQHRVIVRHEDVAPLSITDMTHYDEDNDSDIRFSAATGTPNTLIVRPETELFVWDDDTFVPGGNVTLQSGGSGNTYDGTLHVNNNASFTASGSESHSVGGRFLVDSGATFTPASSTVTMTATTTGKTIASPNVAGIDFHNLVFNGANGEWPITADITIAGDMTITDGTVSGTGDVTLPNGGLLGNGVLTMSAGTVTLEATNTLGGTSAWTFYNLTLGDGSTVGSTTRIQNATTTVLGQLLIRTGHTLALNTSHWDLRGSGTPLSISGVFDADTSTVRYSASTTANVVSTTYYDLILDGHAGTPTYTGTGLGITIGDDLTLGGSANTTFNMTTNDPALAIVGDLAIRTGSTFIASNSGAFTLSGSYDNDGTFTHSSGTLTLNGGGTHTVAAGNSSFGTLVINAAGSYTITEHATTTSAFTLTNAGSFTLSSGRSLAVLGTFTNALGGAATTWTGSTLYLSSGTSYSMNAKTVNEQYAGLIVGANTDVRMWNSSASPLSVNASGSLYSQDHAGQDGDLYIYGDYTRSSGSDYWSYATDFDGTALGGSSRKVDVAFASGASASYTGGTIEILGTASASTTIENQGSGTYALSVAGTATINAEYYELRDLNSTGFAFSGTPTVTSLSRGDIEVSVNGGSGMTVAGSVITQNPAKNFTINRFATSSGIASAYNVTVTGSPSSSWRFTNHYGNIDGEAYDNDPDGDPGYVVWDDSAAQITIAGNVYSDEGTTVSSVCDGATNNVHVRVAGLTSYTTSCNAGTGAYSVPNVAYSAGDTIIVYIDGEAEKAANVTVDPISSIANMHLYENRVIVRHEGLSPVTIADMAVWDSSDDGDIPFTAIDGSPDTLTLPANRKLIVWNAKTFAPNGNVTLSGGGGGAAYDGTLELYANASFTAAGTESHSIGGSFISGSGASLTAAQSTFTFTTSGSGRTIDINEGTFYNATLNGSGSWSMSGSAITIANNFTISAGAVTLPTGTTTIGSSFNNTGGSFAHASGTVLFTATSGGKTVRAGGSSFNTLTFNGSGGAWTLQDTNATTTGPLTVSAGSVTLPSGTLAIRGAFNNEGGTLTHNGGTLRLLATTTDTILRAGGSDLGSVTMAGTGSYAMADLNVTLAGTLAITQGSVTFATGTLSIGGSLNNQGGSFAHASGTVLFNSSDAGEIVRVSGSELNNVSFASPTGGWNMLDSATSTGNFALTSGASFDLASSTTLTVQGVFTNLIGGTATDWTGSTLKIMTGTGYTINTKIAGGDRYNVLRIGADTDLRSWNSSATTTVVSASGSLYSQDHAAVDGSLYIYGDYIRTTGADYWSYATDFDGTNLTGIERAVTVAIASGATTTIDGATLNVRGAAGATTTITHQGSGTYSLTIDGGTLNARYYAVRNTNIEGLSILGLSTITSIQNGDFELALNGGSLITVSSTTVNANPSLTIPLMRFATTSAITGANVELVGATPNAWTFTSHYGNLDGEQFDIDGGTDCGSLRWDDSACLLLEQTDYRWRNDDGGEGVPDSEWYDQDWTKRLRVVIDNADPTEYQDAVVKVVVPYDADMQADFDDLRFTDESGTTTIPYWIETRTASTEAVVWVSVPALAASERTSVFMYYGNGGASDASDGDSTFTVFDDFEDNNITEYSGNTALFTTNTTNVYERTYRLAAADVNAKTTDGIYNTNVSVGQGETIRYFQYVDAAGTGASDEACTVFGVETPGSDNDNYGVCLERFGVDRVSISKDVSNTDDDDGAVQLASSTATYTTGWHEVEVRWGTDDTIAVTLSYDGSVIATTSVADSSYTAAGGIGFTFWAQHGGWDMFTTRPLLATEPTVSFGVEQVPGGASWSTAVNTALTSGVPNETQRIRFVIANSGLPVTSQNFRLDFAAQGGAPSCESVDYDDYVAVPSQASCGSSAICMQTSSEFSDKASTTDLIGGAGAFTYGQIMESPTNASDDLTLATDEFTEVEYAVVATNNATDSNYCLRVTNAGSDLDSYTRVADFGLRFDPSVSAVTLNGGSDIVLSPGTTTTIVATGTVTDLNGYADIVAATSTIFRSGVTDACSGNLNNCYQVGPSACSFSDCSGNSCTVSCETDVYFFADPTDDGAFEPQDWQATIQAFDSANESGEATSLGTELLTLRALTINGTIDYGPLEVSDNTGSYNPTTTVENIGNDSIDVSLTGADLSDGVSSFIPVNNQKYATSTFIYSTCTYCNLLTGAVVGYEVDLSKPTTTTPVISDNIFWGINIPFGVAATLHEGVNTFFATGD